MSDNQEPLSIEIKNPCTVPWESMSGDERARFCGECQLNVYNLSALTSDESRELIRSKEGRLCVSFYRRPDGTVVTKDCVSFRDQFKAELKTQRGKRRFWIVAVCIALVLSIGFTYGVAASTEVSGGIEDINYF